MSRSYAVNTILSRYPSLDAENVVARLRYSTFVSLPRRYMYFEVPKAACSTMKKLLHTLENLPPLKPFVGGLWETRRDMFIHARENMPLPSLADLDDKTQEEILTSPDFLRLTVVRNPYTRLISAWRNKILLCEPGHEDLYRQIRGHSPELDGTSPISFEEFVGYIAHQCDLRTCNPHWRLQTDHMFFDALSFTHIGKVEALGKTLQLFQRHLGRSEPLPVHSGNVSGSTRSVRFTEEMAGEIYSLYEADFKAFGYDRDSWPKPKHNGGDSVPADVVPEEKFNDEIIERNLVIAHLYQERERLLADLQRTPAGVIRRIRGKLQKS